MLRSDKLASLIQEAAKIAELVPENLQEAAFNRALDSLMGETPDIKQRHITEGGAAPPPKVDPPHSALEQSVVEDLISRMNSTAHPDVKSDTTVLGRALRILHVAHVDYDIDGLTPPEIAKVLTDKFRISTPLSSVSGALGNAAGKLVDRVKEGRGYRYRIMADGEKHIASSGQVKQSGSKPTPRHRAKRTQKTEKTAPKKPTSTKRGGRPGPKKLLENLINEEFFSEPRVIKEVIDHVSDAKGHSYKATDLSPALVRLLRDKRLSRKKNSEGQYEYTST